MAMTLRADKGAILSWNEMDANFRACMGVHNLLHVQDQKPSGTHGGTFTTGAWRTRELNTVLVNNIAGASLSANRIMLPAGEYYIEAELPAYAAAAHVAALYSITSSTFMAMGSTAYSNGTYADNVSKISVLITLESSTIIEVQHRCSVTGSFGGFSANIGQAYNIISDLKIWKLS